MRFLLLAPLFAGCASDLYVGAYGGRGDGDLGLSDKSRSLDSDEESYGLFVALGFDLQRDEGGELKPLGSEYAPWTGPVPEPLPSGPTGPVATVSLPSEDNPPKVSQTPWYWTPETAALGSLFGIVASIFGWVYRERVSSLFWKLMRRDSE